MARPPFPRTLAEFQAWFPDEAACRAYLARCRWPDGYRCPRCGHGQAFELPRRGLWQCKGCGHQTSVTAGTVLHPTRTSLRDVRVGDDDLVAEGLETPGHPFAV